MKCVFSGGEMYRRVLRVVRFGEIFFSGEILIWGDSACQPLDERRLSWNSLQRYQLDHRHQVNTYNINKY